MLRGKGRYPVADYRLTAEVDLSALAAMRPDRADLPGGADSGQQQQQQQQGEQQRQGGGAGGTLSCYSFCMCPGGQIVPTSTSEAELCINGMSFSRRNSVWANSALVVGVLPGDWAHLEEEHGPLAGVALQQQIER